MQSFEKQKRKSHRTSTGSSSDGGDGSMGCFGVCMGPSISKRKKIDKKNQIKSKWGNQLSKKVYEIFEENNGDCVPEWLNNF